MGSFHILVVDDYEPFRKFVCALLQEKGRFRISQASAGAEAAEKCRELKPDLILLDIGLPDLNGMEVARRVRELAPATKIVFLSSESDEDIVKEALSLGEGYIHKQRASSDLLSTVEAVLGASGRKGSRGYNISLLLA